MENTFAKSLMDQDTFSVTWELVPGRGAREVSQKNALIAAKQAAEGKKVHALTITDNPGGNPAILADYLGLEIKQLGIEPLVHFTCKDKSRIQLESQLYALDRAGIKNLLVLTGDYPVSGFQGRPKPVFDLDPIHVLQLIEQMNAGLEYQGLRGPIKHQASDFFAGAAVSPFKATEGEQMAQYFKLKKKIAGGARFIITQVGYDARKFHEILQFMKRNAFDVPLIGNIFILSYGAAKAMNSNQLPGCVVTDKLLGEIGQEYSSDPQNGKKAALTRAAKLYAVLKGMGFAGVHIGGHNIKYEQVEYIIAKGEEALPRWMDLVPEFTYPQPGGFYFFTKDKETGLNTEQAVDRKNIPVEYPVDIGYRLSRMVHKMLFEPNKKLFGVMRSLAKRVKGSSLEKVYHGFEHINKVVLYDCKDCGDCALPDLAYICPMSQCPKNQRNGACAGSYNGWCEVYPQERRCVWVKAYARLKKYGEENQLEDYSVAPCNWDLYQKSSWLNFYLGYDHAAERLGIVKQEKKVPEDKGKTKPEG
ncbi:MAG: methylenetetrahydrofolate reductase C-terminal domain-containing protein [Peptococcaceae bacterium]